MWCVSAHEGETQNKIDEESRTNEKKIEKESKRVCAVLARVDGRAKKSAVESSTRANIQRWLSFLFELSKAIGNGSVCDLPYVPDVETCDTRTRTCERNHVIRIDLCYEHSKVTRTIGIVSECMCGCRTTTTTLFVGNVAIHWQCAQMIQIQSNVKQISFTTRAPTSMTSNEHSVFFFLFVRVHFRLVRFAIRFGFGLSHRVRTLTQLNETSASRFFIWQSKNENRFVFAEFYGSFSWALCSVCCISGDTLIGRVAAVHFCFFFFFFAVCRLHRTSRRISFSRFVCIHISVHIRFVLSPVVYFQCETLFRFRLLASH